MVDPTPRDLQILQHVARYRLTTIDVIHKRFCPEITRNAVTKITARLVACGWLKVATLPGVGNYYIVSSEGAARTNAPRRAREDFSEQAFPSAYGVLLFCLKFGVERLTPDEFEQRFPELYSRGLRSTPYFIDTLSEPRRLGAILLDRDNDLRRLQTKVKHLIADRFRIPGFRPWILDRRFSVTILTSSSEKCVQIEGPIREAGQDNVTVRVVVIPELAALYLPTNRRE